MFIATSGGAMDRDGWQLSPLCTGVDDMGALNLLLEVSLKVSLSSLDEDLVE